MDNTPGSQARCSIAESQRLNTLPADPYAEVSGGFGQALAYWLEYPWVKPGSDLADNELSADFRTMPCRRKSEVHFGECGATTGSVFEGSVPVVTAAKRYRDCRRFDLPVRLISG